MKKMLLAALPLLAFAAAPAAAFDHASGGFAVGSRFLAENHIAGSTMGDSFRQASTAASRSAMTGMGSTQASGAFNLNKMRFETQTGGMIESNMSGAARSTLGGMSGYGGAMSLDSWSRIRASR